MPYTVSIYNPSYATIAGSAWNWGASGAANNGVISGPLTAVRANLAVPSGMLLCAQQQRMCCPQSQQMLGMPASVQ